MGKQGIDIGPSSAVEFWRAQRASSEGLPSSLRLPESPDTLSVEEVSAFWRDVAVELPTNPPSTPTTGVVDVAGLVPTAQEINQRRQLWQMARQTLLPALDAILVGTPEQRATHLQRWLYELSPDAVPSDFDRIAFVADQNVIVGFFDGNANNRQPTNLAIMRISESALEVHLNGTTYRIAPSSQSGARLTSISGQTSPRAAEFPEPELRTGMATVSPLRREVKT